MLTNNSPEQILKDKLKRFFLQMASVKGTDERNEDDVDSFVFHINECFDDFRQICKLQEHPDQFSDEEVEQIMQGLLYHALPHLIASARQYDCVIDIL